jgi:Uma2 family endonuclease
MAVLPQAASIDLAPDWVCEILSPSTVSIDRVRKLRIYAREKVTHAWLIDPLSRTLEVFRLEGANWLLAAVYANDEIIRAEPFDAIPLDLLDLWGETRTVVHEVD